MAAIDSVGLVALPFGGWAVLLVGAALMLHTVYLFRSSWPAEGWLQAGLAIVAVVAGFGMVTSTDQGASPLQPISVQINPLQSPATQSPATQSTPVQSTQNNGGTFCYSGGQCYINGEPVSGHP